MLPYAHNCFGDNFIFQQDNDSKHIVRHIKNHLAEEKGHSVTMAIPITKS